MATGSDNNPGEVTLCVGDTSELLASGDGAGGMLGLGNDADTIGPDESALLLVLFTDRPPLLAPEGSTELTCVLSARKAKNMGTIEVVYSRTNLFV